MLSSGKEMQKVPRRNLDLIFGNGTRKVRVFERNIQKVGEAKMKNVSRRDGEYSWSRSVCFNGLARDANRYIHLTRKKAFASHSRDQNGSNSFQWRQLRRSWYDNGRSDITCAVRG